MTHGRKPRKPRVINANVFDRVHKRATLLIEEEIQGTLRPTIECFKRLREGVATEEEFNIVNTAMEVSIEIEESGIVKGMRAFFDDAVTALNNIQTRALASGSWKPTSLWFHELDALREAIHFHEFQLRQLSAGELNGITRKLINRTLSNGGALITVHRPDLGLVAA